MALVVAAVAMLVAAPSAYADSSGAPCPTPSSTSQVFSQFGDNNAYTLLPGGDFQNEDTSGWTLNNASLGQGAEPWGVSGASESQSLSLAPGGQAISPTFCVSNLYPFLRFFAQNTQNSGSWWGNSLRVSVQWTNSYGNTLEIPIGALQSGNYQSWQPTPPIMLGAPLPNGMTFNVRLVFTAGSSSSWQVDDVYVDPYAK